MNRVLQWLEEPDERPPVEDYVVIAGDAGVWYVSLATGEALQRQLRRRWPPRWLRFVDIFGAQVCILTRTVRVICESTRLQRRSERVFYRNREREDQEGSQPWE